MPLLCMMRHLPFSIKMLLKNFYGITRALIFIFCITKYFLILYYFVLYVENPNLKYLSMFDNKFIKMGVFFLINY